MSLWNMLPRLSPPRISYGCSADTKSNGQGGLRVSRGPDVEDVLFRQFGLPVALAKSSAILAGKAFPLFMSILHVIGVCARAQMSRVYTRRVVAGMHDLGPGRYRAIVQLPRKPMHGDDFAVDVERSIARALSRPNPFPTLVYAALVDIPPKTGKHVALWLGGLASAARGTKPTLLEIGYGIRVVTDRRESVSAKFAGFFVHMTAPMQSTNGAL